MPSASDHLHIADHVECSVTGESLEDILRTGPIAPTRVLEISIQIAEALEPKHAAGLIHGHITAAEVFLEHSGRVSLRHRFRPGSAQEEQMAFGRLLSSALDGATTALPPLRWTIDRLLADKPEDRYASTRDLYLELRAIRDRLPQTETSAKAPALPSNTWMNAKPAHNRHAFIALPITLVCCCVVIVLLMSHSPLPKRGKVSLQSFPVWSSDGRRILFVKAVNGVDQVFVQSSDGAPPVQLTHSPEPSANPRWVPDGSAVVFERAGKSSTVSFLKP
jgi:hypothetical protein